MTLTEYGLTPARAAQQPAGLTLARITTQDRTLYTAVVETGSVRAEVAGRLANMAAGPEDFPAVGDWVLLRGTPTAGDVAIIERLLPRTSVFSRVAAGRSGTEQVVAANVDTLMLCMALDENFNLRRMERYLAVANASGAMPAIVLTKADKAPDLTGQLSAVRALSGEAAVVFCDATRTDGIAALAALIDPGKTVAFLGSSGVGKTTLINRLLGEDRLATGAIRENDAHGRHTTTSRDLLLLPSGGIVIDTPGMRALSLLDADTETTFADITDLAAHCRFNDCTHQQEPGCAVQAAIAAETLDPERLASFRRLQQEQAVNVALRGRARERAKIDQIFGSRKQMKQVMRASKQRRR
ncbi:ribosome small subunit-dependent GTPase A [Lacticaseibacillus mingshuiensis]|uniref:Small ribosomal subunit biogenesis GTPase RsgA n=1 Tax=Lacticaseibacillus mingshuiensis TaxID=2799574 RepID=A0ABW4CHS2_9LACO|nr:ribosome small subunit-dependent GTPase A [Lacticaseibacillus mingshuiensis]